MIKLFLLLSFLSNSSISIKPSVETNTTTLRSIETTKISVASNFTAPKIDGNLDDECWKNVSVNSDFITSSPEFGKPSVFKTEVKIIYDDNAIYIGAHLFDAECNKISCQLSQRDEQGNADWFSVGFDTYNDNINGYRFQVSAAGVQQDARLSPGNFDLNWDAVWFSKVKMTKDGWIAEIKIPYSAIRFPKKDDQTWGLQFARFVQRTNEISSWSPINPQINGLVNQWGELAHLKNLNPPLRLSFVPYITGGFQREPVSVSPKEMTMRRILSGGLDINWGINESFTLNTTLIPDFGQVQSDNKILNLSPFEQQFDEHRPFFTEGTELFNQQVGLGPGQLFYSRRIGGVPSKYFDVPYLLHENESVISNPSVVQLYNATKFSGRTKSGLGVGVINAVGAAMYAQVQNDSTGEKRKIETEPLTNYNILVFDQSLKNNSRIGLTNTNVMRGASWRKANVTSLNFVVKDKTNTFSYSGFANFSQIYDKQISNKPQFGFYADYIASKISGKFRFDFEEYMMSDKYDQNDLGILFHPNEISHFIGGKYFDYAPKGKINSRDASVSLQYTSLYKPFVYQDFSINASTTLYFKNFWYWGFVFNSKPAWYYDYYEARIEGMKFHRAPYVYGNVYFGSDARKTYSIEADFGIGESPLPKDPEFDTGITQRLRIKNNFIFFYTFDFVIDKRNWGFADFDDAGNPVIGRRDTKKVVNTFNIKYSITPVMNISVRARHYWTRVSYDGFYSLNEEGNVMKRDWEKNEDKNFNAWNIDFVYDWRFAPGSDLILTWKQNITQTDQRSADNYFTNAEKTFHTPQSNMVSLKLIYYLDYAQMKEWNDKRKGRKRV